MSRNQLRLFLAPGLLLFGLISACGGPDPVVVINGSAGGLQRLQLVADERQESAETTRVALFNAPKPATVTPEDPVRWSGEAPEFKFTRRPQRVRSSNEPEDSRVSAYYVRGAGPMSVVLDGEFDPALFNTIVLEVENVGPRPDELHLELMSGDKKVLKTPPQTLKNFPKGLAPIEFVLPELRRHAVDLDQIRVMIAGKSDPTTIALSSVQLVRTPIENLLDVDSAGETILSIEGDSRTGVLIGNDVTVRGRGVAGEASRLRFSSALVEQTRLRNQAPVLTWKLSRKGQQLIQGNVELEDRLRDKARWHDFDLDLASYGPGPVELEFALKTRGEEPIYSLVTESRLVSLGEDAPTILLISSDTHRGDHVGYNGGPVQTPILDGLARDGVAFTNAFTSTNVTNPSHIALMTAKGPRDTRITNNNTRLVSRATTLAERFRAAGYRTLAATSAFHLAHAESGLGQGFDRVSSPKHTRFGGKSVDDLEVWLDASRGEPLFVWLHVFDAHAPYASPAEFDRKYYGKDKDPYEEGAGPGIPEGVDPPYFKGLRDIDFAYQQYRAAVDYVDFTVARVLLRKRFANAIVAFTADHGENFGDHGVWWDHSEMYPSSIHVPLILRWPGAPAGTMSAHPVKQTDIGFTLLELAGIGAADFPGGDLRRALEPDAPTEPRFGLAAHGMSAYIQSGRWFMKVHLKNHQEWSLERKRFKHETELYDLEADFGCLTNLIDAERDRALRMREALVQWLIDAPSTGMGSAGEFSAQLQDLGYVGGEEEVGDLFDPACVCEHCDSFR